MGACPPLGMRLQKFLTTYVMLLPEEEKGMFQFHLSPFHFFLLKKEVKLKLQTHFSHPTCAFSAVFPHYLRGKK